MTIQSTLASLRRVALFCLFVAASAGVPGLRAQATADRQPSTVFRNARVFDGLRVREQTDVLVRSGRIVAVGRALRVAGAPGTTTEIDAKGKTLLPGLIDAHAHAFGTALQAALAFGVTTELDMFTDPMFARTMRAEQAAGNVASRADLFSAGTLVTSPKGRPDRPPVRARRDTTNVDRERSQTRAPHGRRGAVGRPRHGGVFCESAGDADGRAALTKKLPPALPRSRSRPDLTV